MENGENTDANGWAYRKGGGSPIGESMPGTFGDSERVLHDQNGSTPAAVDDVEVPADRAKETEEKTETGDLSVEELVRLNE